VTTHTHSEEDWTEYLTQSLRAPLVVRYGRSRRLPLQLRRALKGSREPAQLRLHGGVFESPTDEVLALVGTWVAAVMQGQSPQPETRTRIRSWIDEQLQHIPATRREPKIEVEGRAHDLNALADRVVSSSFEGQFGAALTRPLVTWGRRGKSRSRRSLRMGSYQSNQDLIRIHSVLDQTAVPEWFVRFILFHEFLHAALPSQRDEAGRKRHHTPEFRRREREHPDYQRSSDWEKIHIRALIRSASLDRPMR
jgi:hypothetical protein